MVIHFLYDIVSMCYTIWAMMMKNSMYCARALLSSHMGWNWYIRYLNESAPQWAIWQKVCFSFYSTEYNNSCTAWGDCYIVLQVQHQDPLHHKHMLGARRGALVKVLGHPPVNQRQGQNNLQRVWEVPAPRPRARRRCLPQYSQCPRGGQWHVRLPCGVTRMV